MTDSDRALESWDTLPADSQARVDYPTMGALAPLRVLKETRDLCVDITVYTPDGTRVSLSEVVEYDVEDDGEIPTWDAEDIPPLLERAMETMIARFS